MGRTCQETMSLQASRWCHPVERAMHPSMDCTTTWHWEAQAEHSTWLWMWCNYSILQSTAISATQVCPTLIHFGHLGPAQASNEAAWEYNAPIHSRTHRSTMCPTIIKTTHVHLGLHGVCTFANAQGHTLPIIGITVAHNLSATKWISQVQCPTKCISQAPRLQNEFSG